MKACTPKSQGRENSFHTLCLGSEVVAIIVFYFTLKYSIATIVCTASLCISIFYDVEMTREDPSSAIRTLRASLKVTAGLVVFLTYLPDRVMWYTILLGALLLFLKITECLTVEGRRGRIFGALWDLFFPLTWILYACEITPPPDDQLSAKSRSWIQAVGVFAYLIACTTYVVGLAFVLSKQSETQSNEYDLQQDAELLDFPMVATSTVDAWTKRESKMENA